MTTISDLDDKVSLKDIDLDTYKSSTRSGSDASGGMPIRAMGIDYHEITFKVDNSATSYNLTANSTVFADWGSFSGSPTNVLARTISDSACKVSENRGFFTGAAGMIGFSMTADNSTVYLRFAATDPYWSARSNRTMVELTTEDKGIDQGNYNRIYDWGGYAEIDFAGKKLKVSSDVGSSNTCTATYRIKVE